MTLKELSNLLNGRQYGEELTQKEEDDAKDAGLLVLFGYSDDNVEIRGAFSDEIGVGSKSFIYLHSNGALPYHNEPCDCDFCGYGALKKKCAKIQCLHGENGWTYKTDLAHECFDILDGKEQYCKGLVISQKDLPDA